MVNRSSGWGEGQRENPEARRGRSRDHLWGRLKGERWKLSTFLEKRPSSGFLVGGRIDEGG
jgi:hypothetical protein